MAERDDLDLLRHDRDARRRTGRARPSPGSPAFVGRVTTASPATSKFVLVNPVTVLGAQVEGGAGTLTVDTSVTVPVYILRGTPATGNDLIVEAVDYRWTATIGVTTPPTTIVYPNCPCTPMPAVLAMHVVATAPCDTTVYRDCTIRWVTPIPTAYSSVALGTTGAFLSDESFVDSAGFTFRYQLACFAAAGGQSQFDLYRLYATQPGKAATREGPRYEWITAATGNTCHPFSLLLKGSQPLGSNSGNCVVQLTDAT